MFALGRMMGNIRPVSYDDGCEEGEEVIPLALILGGLMSMVAMISFFSDGKNGWGVAMLVCLLVDIVLVAKTRGSDSN